MLSYYALEGARLRLVDRAANPRPQIAWIDLLQPTREEEDEVERLLGIDVPTREEMAEIETSSRLYRENDTLYLTASVLVGGDRPLPETAPVSFILTRDRLVTVRYAEPSVFRTFGRQADKSDADMRSADGVFIALLEAMIDRTADILERVSGDVDALSRQIFTETDNTVSRDYRALLGRIGRSGDLNARVRESLVSIGRLVNFLAAECGDLHPNLRERTETMAADIRSIADHASFVASNIVFLLDATLGLINIEQNAVIRILSVVSVVVMPPMLIASVYGMNFDFMPELNWRAGYPLALVSMILAAIIPFWYFRRRGWL